MENRKLDPKTIKNMSYSTLLGMRESDHPARKIDWPTRAHRYHAARNKPGEPPMKVGESRWGIHNGVTYRLTRTK